MPFRMAFQILKILYWTNLLSILYYSPISGERELQKNSVSFYAIIILVYHVKVYCKNCFNQNINVTLNIKLPASITLPKTEIPTELFLYYNFDVISYTKNRTV